MHGGIDKMENQKEIEKIDKIEEIEERGLFLSPYKIFFWEAVLFCLTLGLGIIVAFNLNKFLEVQEITLPQISFWKFLSYFVVATLFILAISFLIKVKKRKGLIYKGIFVLTALWGGAITLSLLMPDIFALVLMVILILRWHKAPSVFLHNLIMILGLAGVGAVLGLQIAPLVAVALLIILSLYDFIAVYKTKHMVKMAKEMIEQGTILALIVPQKISDFKAGIKEVKAGGKFLILGGGDVAFPLLLCASLVSDGIINSLIVFVFALIGLFFSFWIFISQKTRKPIPALPLIALFSIIGFLLTLLV